MDKKAKHDFKTMLVSYGYSEKVADEIRKCYDFKREKELPASSCAHGSLQAA